MDVRTTTRPSGCRGPRRRPRSRRPSGSSPASTIRTRSPATRRPSSGSRTSTRPTTSCPTRTSGRSTTASGRTGRPTAPGGARAGGPVARGPVRAGRPVRGLRELRRRSGRRQRPVRVPAHGRSRLLPWCRRRARRLQRLLRDDVRQRCEFAGIDGSRQAGASRPVVPVQRQALQPVEATAEISLEEAFHGTSRIVELDGRRLEVTIPRGRRHRQPGAAVRARARTVATSSS